MHTLKYIISLVFCLVFINSFAQKQPKSEEKKDSIIYKTGYGFRVGIDISKPLLPLIDKSYNGFELVADYRISKKWYLTTEMGYESDTTFEDYLQATSKGNYIRLGANYNVYNNWLDMNNEIYVGGRYGYAIFEQILNNYTPNVNSHYFPAQIITTPITTKNLNKHWIELQLGIKVETFKNLFIGFHGSYKVSISSKTPDNFTTLYAPGFNKVFATNTGFGFNYTISYLIPFVKK